MAEATSKDDTVAFLGTVLEHWASTYTTVLAALGDRLGLWKALAAAPMSAGELAVSTGLDERYVAEWAAAMTVAAYITHDPAAATFALAPGVATALAEEGDPLFVGGGYQNLLGLLGVLDEVTDAFRTGAGVAYSEYPPDTFEGMARLTAPAHEHALVSRWLPLAPDVEARLRAGAKVLDIGCGQGRAILAMAGAYPASSFTGIDGHRPVIERARATAGALGIGDRVRFEIGDALEGISDAPYDIVCAFDVLHDAADPPGLLQAARTALAPGGAMLLLEPNSADTIEGNTWPLGAMNLGVSVLYCMSVSRGSGGPGLGTCGTPERVVRDMAVTAGFDSVVEAPIKNLFNRLYVLT
ncbi:MAG: class I SAM-dependent methyltransferase [Acidimicrobiales bacterium]